MTIASIRWGSSVSQGLERKENVHWHSTDVGVWETFSPFRLAARITSQIEHLSIPLLWLPGVIVGRVILETVQLLVRLGTARGRIDAALVLTSVCLREVGGGDLEVLIDLAMGRHGWERHDG